MEYLAVVVETELKIGIFKENIYYLLLMTIKIGRTIKTPNKALFPSKIPNLSSRLSVVSVIEKGRFHRIHMISAVGLCPSVT